MVTGSLSRESCRQAFSNGITAEQIIYYLTTHAHPQMQKNVVKIQIMIQIIASLIFKNPVLPPTVVDQIKLWELEKNRLKATEGYLFRDFSSAIAYERARQNSSEQGLTMYENSQARMFFVIKEGKQIVADFIRRNQDDDRA